jgi:hypothetical protein
MRVLDLLAFFIRSLVHFCHSVSGQIQTALELIMVRVGSLWRIPNPKLPFIWPCVPVCGNTTMGCPMRPTHDVSYAMPTSSPSNGVLDPKAQCSNCWETAKCLLVGTLPPPIPRLQPMERYFVMYISGPKACSDLAVYRCTGPSKASGLAGL